MHNLDGKAAIVTGGGSGIGAELVRQLCAQGASVLGADLNQIGLAGVAERTGYITRVVDVGSEADNAAMVGAAEAEFGVLDLLFLNAGVLGRSAEDQRLPIADVAELASRYRHVMSANVDGVVHGTLAAADALDDGGSIVVTASIAGLVPWAPDPVYTVTKHGVVGWVRRTRTARHHDRCHLSWRRRDGVGWCHRRDGRRGPDQARPGPGRHGDHRDGARAGDWSGAVSSGGSVAGTTRVRVRRRRGFLTPGGHRSAQLDPA